MSLTSVGVTVFEEEEEEEYRALLRGCVVDGDPDVVRVAIVRLVAFDQAPNAGGERELRRICAAWEALQTRRPRPRDLNATR